MLNPDFAKGGGLIPAIIQDVETRQVLMLGYMNEAAWQTTQDTGKVTFYSRSKERLWTKGEESGNYLVFKNAQLDCDQDTLLIHAEPAGPVCHKGTYTCFGEEKQKGVAFLEHLESALQERVNADPESSYTSRLHSKGIDKIAQKLGEEAVETVIASKNQDQQELLEESADLIYHFLVLLHARNANLSDVVAVLQTRHQKANKKWEKG